MVPTRAAFAPGADHHVPFLKGEKGGWGKEISWEVRPPAGEFYRKDRQVEGLGIIHSKPYVWESKNLQTINAGESVEKREPSCTVGGNVN